MRPEWHCCKVTPVSRQTTFNAVAIGQASQNRHTNSWTLSRRWAQFEYEASRSWKRAHQFAHGPEACPGRLRCSQYLFAAAWLTLAIDRLTCVLGCAG